MRINKKVIFLLITIIFCLFALTACYNLGDGTESDEEYRENYSLIRLVDRDSDTYDYSMEDFYTDDAVNDLVSPLSEEERREYTYIFIKTEKALDIGEIAIYFDSTVEADVNVKVFVMDEDDLPTKIYTGILGKYTAFECDEPDLSDAVGDVTFRVSGTAGKWKEFYLKSWGKKGETSQKRYHLSEGQFLVFRISNNCYDPAKRIFDIAEQKWKEAVEEYETTSAEYQAAERDYNAAKAKYESEKGPDLERVPIRITAVLIYAD